MATAPTYGRSWAKDRIRTAAVTCAVSLNTQHWARDQTRSSTATQTDAVRFLTGCATAATPKFPFLSSILGFWLKPCKWEAGCGGCHTLAALAQQGLWPRGSWAPSRPGAGHSQAASQAEASASVLPKAGAFSLEQNSQRFPTREWVPLTSTQMKQLLLREVTYTRNTTRYECTGSLWDDTALEGYFRNLWWQFFNVTIIWGTQLAFRGQWCQMSYDLSSVPKLAPTKSMVKSAGILWFFCEPVSTGSMMPVIVGVFTSQKSSNGAFFFNPKSSAAHHYLKCTRLPCRLLNEPWQVHGGENWCIRIWD